LIRELLNATPSSANVQQEAEGLMLAFL
jgi:hypothetical protein